MGFRLLKKKRQAAEGKTERKKRTVVDYEMLAAKILGFAARHEWFNAMHIREKFNLSSESVARGAINRLIKAGKLKTSGKGPGRKIELATSKNGNGKAVAA